MWRLQRIERVLLRNALHGRYRAEAARMSRVIWSLEKEREKYAAEASEGAARHQEVGSAGALRIRAWGGQQSSQAARLRQTAAARPPAPLCSSAHEAAAAWRPAPTQQQALEDVKARETAIVELQKRVSDGEGRLKQQQVDGRGGAMRACVAGAQQENKQTQLTRIIDPLPPPCPPGIV